MTKYKNLSGESGILAYEIGSDFIRFNLRIRKSTYTEDSAGIEHIAKMKELAEKGRGLNTYVNQHVRKNYETKET